VSREQVRQIEDAALNALRDRLKEFGLEGLVAVLLLVSSVVGLLYFLDLF
jgi:hypothetical protein